MTPSTTSYELSKRLHDLGLRVKESLYVWVESYDSVGYGGKQKRTRKHFVRESHDPEPNESAIPAFTTDELAELVKGFEWNLEPTGGGGFIFGFMLNDQSMEEDESYWGITPCEALGLYVEALIKSGELKV